MQQNIEGGGFLLSKKKLMTMSIGLLLAFAFAIYVNAGVNDTRQTSADDLAYDVVEEFIENVIAFSEAIQFPLDMDSLQSFFDRLFSWHTPRYANYVEQIEAVLVEINQSFANEPIYDRAARFHDPEMRAHDPMFLIFFTPPDFVGYEHAAIGLPRVRRSNEGYLGGARRAVAFYILSPEGEVTCMHNEAVPYHWYHYVMWNVHQSGLLNNFNWSGFAADVLVCICDWDNLPQEWIERIEEHNRFIVASRLSDEERQAILEAWQSSN